MAVPYKQRETVDETPIYPGWRGPDGLVHIVGLHTNTRIMTECRLTIVNSGNVWVQVEKFEQCFDPPTCLFCIAEFEPY